VLPVILGLEERDAQVEFKHDTANTPDVTSLAPAEFEDHFWGPVMAGRDDGGVMLMIKCSGAKVNESNFRILDPADSFLPTTIIAHIIVRIQEQNVLWLQVRVRQLILMKVLDRMTELVRNVTNVLQGIRIVVVVLLQCQKWITLKRPKPNATAEIQNIEFSDLPRNQRHSIQAFQRQ